jgi:hypothetical protein
MATLQEEMDELREAFREFLKVIGFIRLMDWLERKLRCL